MGVWDWITSTTVATTLFDGILGATIGALVAIMVLRRTLREQRAALVTQLQAQDAHLYEQLSAQDRHHKEQLEAQRAQHKKQLEKQSQDLKLQLETQKRADEAGRLRQSVAAFLGDLADLALLTTLGGENQEREKIANSQKALISLNRIYFDLANGEVDFYEAVASWVRHFIRPSATALSAPEHNKSAAPDGATPSESRDSHGIDSVLIMHRQVTWLTMHIATWVRSDTNERSWLVERIRVSLEVARISGTVWEQTYPPEVAVNTDSPIRPSGG